MTLKLPAKYKLYIGLIIFSFIWVIIGDLVSMHVRVICDVEIQKHSPFTDIHKTVKKLHKQKGDKNYKYSKHLDFLETENINLKINTVFLDIDVNTLAKVYDNKEIKLFLGRAPPKFV